MGHKQNFVLCLAGRKHTEYGLQNKKYGCFIDISSHCSAHVTLAYDDDILPVCSHDKQASIKTISQVVGGILRQVQHCNKWYT